MKWIKKYRTIKMSAILLIMLTACSEYLDVVPEGVATIDLAFNQRDEALKYLYTCYSYMPKHGNLAQDPAILGGDELITYNESFRFNISAFQIALGMQNATSPILDKWGSLYQGIRDCNIFLENVHKVPDLPDWERDQWIAEVKFLKAYYHFYLIQTYGPIPLVKENLPVDVVISEVKAFRDPVDSCFSYVVKLLDETRSALPLKVLDPATELGRITRPAALSLKAKVLVTAASPLFNGNNDQSTLRNSDGTPLFNATYVPEKWNAAVTACKEALAVCDEAGMELYYYPASALTKLTDTIVTQLSLRNAFCERWNSEIIWANTQSIAAGGASGIQQLATAKLNPSFRDAPQIGPASICPPLKMSKLFYTQHGVPISEDKTRNAGMLYSLRTAQTEEKLYIKAGSTTVDLHFDREPRFYAWLGFDCGIWYGQGKTDDKLELWSVEAKKGNIDGHIGTNNGTRTGYFCKKYVHYNNVISSLTSYSVTPYPWPVIRLSDLYLLYAEAINEAEGPDGANQVELFRYIDLVRARAGLEAVKDSWDKYTNNPKYSTKEGMRQIIQQERMIELAFEGHRFWDVRRWKSAPDVYNSSIESWSVQQYETANFYRPEILYTQTFGVKDYFWPVKNSDIINNRKLIQNIGW
ncbi:MAG: RagB/SusD family nutrient uptake outer membrane protein [Prolixibacteraceae bacterium]